MTSLWEAVFLFLSRWLIPHQLLGHLGLGMKEQSQGLELPCLYLTHLLKEIKNSRLCQFQCHLLFHRVHIPLFLQANSNSRLINKMLLSTCQCHQICNLLRIRCLCCHILLIYLDLHPSYSHLPMHQDLCLCLQCQVKCLVQWYETISTIIYISLYMYILYSIVTCIQT